MKNNIKNSRVSDILKSGTIAKPTAFYAIEKFTSVLKPSKLDSYIISSEIPNLHIPKIGHFAEIISGSQDNIKQLFKNMDEICSILAEYNYLLPLTLDFNVYSDLLNYLNNTKDEKNREKEIDKFLLKLFSERKWQMAFDIVNRLHENNKINPKRIVILEDCIKILKYNSRKTAANTILPVLITQIEGIWVDTLGIKDKNKLKNIIQNMKNDKYVNPAAELLADILFQHTKTQLPIKPDFCRNKILHGEEVEYGSIYNVIRAFLIIEFLDFIKTDDELEENITV